MNTAIDDHIVRFSISGTPDLPSWVKSILYPHTFQRSGEPVFDASALEQHTIPEQNQPWQSGELIYQHHINHKMLIGDLGYHELHAILGRGPSFYKSHFGEKSAVGWKSIVLSKSDHIFVAFISVRRVVLESGSTDGLYLDWQWIGNGHFFPDSIALRYPKKS